MKLDKQKAPTLEELNERLKGMTPATSVKQQDKSLTTALTKQTTQMLAKLAMESPENPVVDVDDLLDQRIEWRQEENQASPNNQAALIKAQVLFIRGFNKELILADTNVPNHVFTWHAFKKANSWYQTRNALYRELVDAQVKEVVTEKVKTLSDIMTLSLEGLKGFVAEIAMGERQIEGTREAKLLSDIVANIHRIGQLEQGKPTAISNTMQAMTPQQVKERAIELFKEMDVADGVVVYSKPAQGS